MKKNHLTQSLLVLAFYPKPFSQYIKGFALSKLLLLTMFLFLGVQTVFAQPPTPVGLDARITSPTAGPGEIFLACGPNQVGSNNIVYRLFYSLTASAPTDPLTATQYTFGSTPGDGNGTAAFGFMLSGLTPGTSYTFWLYQYNTVTMQYSTGNSTDTQVSGAASTTPPTPVGLDARITSPTAGAGQIFLACGPNQTGSNNIVYRLFYSLTASAPADPLTATQYTFGSTPGDGNGTAAFGFMLSGLTPGTSYTFWLYQYNTVTMLYSTGNSTDTQVSGAPVVTPSTAAPIAPAGACVLSIFSDSYTNVSGTNFDPNWGQATDATIVSIAGNNTLQYMGLNYQGTQFGSNQDVSKYGFLHVDFWTDNSTALNFYLISPGVENAYNLMPHVVAGQWVSVDIPLSHFTANKANVFQFKVDGNGNVWFDNLYFHGGTDRNVFLPPMSTSADLTTTSTCTDGAWTYYEHPTKPGNYLFAIEWGSGNDAAKAAAAVKINTQTAPYTAPGSNSTAAAVAMARYWNVNIGGNTLVNPVNVKFFYAPAEVAGVNTTISTYGTSNGFFWYKNISGDYTHAGTIPSPNFAPNIIVLTPAAMGTEAGVSYVQFNGITSFSGGSGAATAGAPLPIELISFEGRNLESINQLTWATASEKNTEWHVIERSSNAKSDWIEIGKVRAVGTTRNTQYYEFMDKSPIANGYYRIQSIDFDSRAQYSNVIHVAREGAVGDISFYPNPVTNQLNVDFTTLEAEEVRLSITDVTGRLVFNQTNEANRGHNSYKVNFDHFKSGVYFITMTNTNGSVTKRLIKN